MITCENVMKYGNSVIIGVMPYHLPALGICSRLNVSAHPRQIDNMSRYGLRAKTKAGRLVPLAVKTGYSLESGKSRTRRALLLARIHSRTYGVNFHFLVLRGGRLICLLTWLLTVLVHYFLLHRQWLCVLRKLTNQQRKGLEARNIETITRPAAKERSPCR